MNTNKVRNMGGTHAIEWEDAFKHTVIIIAKHIMRQLDKSALVHNRNRFLEIVTNHAIYFCPLVVKLHLEVLNHINDFILTRHCSR